MAKKKTTTKTGKKTTSKTGNKRRPSSSSRAKSKAPKAKNKRAKKRPYGKSVHKIDKSILVASIIGVLLAILLILYYNFWDY